MSNIKIITLLACLAAVPAVEAIELADDGTGDALLVPYYSALHGATTLVSIANHADAAKAVRVVVAEAYNGRNALAFNVYLAPRDTWSGALVARSALSDVPPALTTADSSCTSIDFGASGVVLSEAAFSGDADDGAGQDPARTAEGQIEIIELGTLSGPAAQLAQARDCAGLRSRFAAGGTWAADANADVGKPTGSLSAQAHLVQVEEGIAFDIETTAFEQFSGAARHGNAIADANAARIYKPTLEMGMAEFIVDGDARIPASRPADAVSLALMASRLEGPFMANDSIDASTRWVVAFPTWPAYIDNRPGGELPVGSPQRAPFAASSTFQAGPFTCLPSEWRTIDRAGELSAVRTMLLCGAVEIVSVIDDGMPDPPLPRDFFPEGVEEGRLRADFNPSHALVYSTGPLTDNATLKGLPVVAISLMRARNKLAQPGLLATYGMTGRVIKKQEGGIDF